MADVSKINLYGTEYTIKDTTARSTADNASNKANSAYDKAGNAESTANSALNTANNNTDKITTLSNESIKMSYDSSSESIGIAKGITIS